MIRQIHDTAFAIASALTEKMDYKLVDAEEQTLYKLVHEARKAAITDHEAKREAERVGGGINESMQ